MCKAKNVLFIADEVQTGLGRTGKMLVALELCLELPKPIAQCCDHEGVRPDILILGKVTIALRSVHSSAHVLQALSGGVLPVSAVLITDAIWKGMLTESEKIGVFGHGYTYSAHPVAAAVAIETLKIYEERDIGGHVRKVAPRFQAADFVGSSSNGLPSRKKNFHPPSMRRTLKGNGTSWSRTLPCTGGSVFR